MKLLLLTVLTIFTFSSAKGQILSLRTVGGTNGFENKFFEIIPTSIDSNEVSNFVGHVYHKNNLVISIAFKLETDSGGIKKQTIVKTLIHDSLLIKKYPEEIDSTIYEKYEVTIVEGIDLNKQYPILINKTFENTRLSKVDSLTIAPAKKIINSFKVGGRITTTAQLADETYLGQQLPQNYSRTMVQADIELMGIPFNAGYLYTTENQQVNSINNFRFSLDNNKLLQNTKDKLNKKLKEQNGDKFDRYQTLDYKKTQTDYHELKNRLESDYLKSEIQKNEAILKYAEVDTGFKSTFQYKKAKIDQDSIAKQRERLGHMKNKLAEYDQLKSNYNTDLNKAQFETYRNQRKFKKALKEQQINTPFSNTLLDLKRFEIGTFNPSYNQLVINGVSLTGLNTEINKGLAYAALAVGFVQQNTLNPFSFQFNRNRNLMLTRVGVGRTEKTLIAISFLRGRDNFDEAVRDTLNNIYLPKFNYVLGVDIKHQYKQVELGVEVASSLSLDATDDSKQRDYSPVAQIEQVTKTRTGAWSFYTTTTISETKTRLKFQLRKVDPFFYSYGTPYLRQDNLRTEFKAEQPLFKNRMLVGATFRRDQDNLYEQKNGTSKNTSYIFTSQFRFKKFPVISLFFSPNFQSYYNHTTKQQIQAEVTIAQGTLTYLIKRKKWISTSTAILGRQWSSSNQTALPGFDLKQASFMQTFQLLPANVTLNSSISTGIQATDSGSFVSISGHVTWGVFNNKCQIQAGYTYHIDYAIQTRNILHAGTTVTLIKGLVCTITFEKHYIQNYSEVIEQANTMHMGRITIIKSF